MRPPPAQACLGLLHTFEGFVPQRYLDSGGRPTIGCGHLLSGPADPLWNAHLTPEEGDQLALQDLVTRAAQPLSGLLSDTAIDGLTDGQYAALLDFTYNEGAGRFGGSSLRRDVIAGDHAAAAGEFGKWIYGMVDGAEQVLPGLVKRRAAEAALWSAAP